MHPVPGAVPVRGVVVVLASQSLGQLAALGVVLRIAVLGRQRVVRVVNDLDEYLSDMPWPEGTPINAVDQFLAAARMQVSV